MSDKPYQLVSTLQVIQKSPITHVNPRQTSTKTRWKCPMCRRYVVEDIDPAAPYANHYPNRLICPHCTVYYAKVRPTNRGVSWYYEAWAPQVSRIAVLMGDDDG